MATLTTVIVFLPVSLVEGEGQFFLIRMAIPVTVSLLASLLVALVFIPLAVYLTLPASGNGRKRRAASGAPTERVNAVLAAGLRRHLRAAQQRLLAAPRPGFSAAASTW